MNSTRREPKIVENKSIGCGLQVPHGDGDSNLQQERTTQSKVTVALIDEVRLRVLSAI